MAVEKMGGGGMPIATDSIGEPRIARHYRSVSWAFLQQRGFAGKEALVAAAAQPAEEPVT
jgi:hypothetical protein